MCEQGLAIPCGTATDAFAFQYVIYDNEAALNAAILAAYPDFVSWATPYCLANLSSGGTTTAIIVQRVGRLHDGNSFLTCPLSGFYTFDGNVYDLGTQLSLLQTAIQNYYGVIVSWDTLHCAFFQIDSTAVGNILPAQIPLTPALPIAEWNETQGQWAVGSEGAFYVSDPTNGISLQTAAGAPLSNCTTGVADVEMEVYKDGVLDGAASYEYGAFMLAALSTSLNWGQYLPHFGFFTVENGSIFIFDKAQWAQATGAFGKTAAEAAALEFRIRAKDCYGVWSNWDVTNVEKQQILGGDNTLTDNGGGSYSEQVIGGLYATDDPALTVGGLVICVGINHVSAPFMSGTLDNTAWQLRSYTIGGVTNGTTQPIYNLTGEPRLDLVNELERIHSGYDWNFGNNAITDALYPNCAERAGGYYYSQPINEGATDLLTAFAVGNAVYDPIKEVRYHINPITWF